jgi:MFS family permease
MARIEPPRAPNIPPEIMPIRARQFRIPKTFASLRHRNYQLFIIGQLVSLAGVWMQIIAQGWLVYDISSSEFALGLVGFASAVPVLMITPFAGVVVDQVDKRMLLVITQTLAKLSSFVLAALIFADLVEVWHVIVVAAVLGVVNAFDGPARQAFVVDMVGREDLPNAIALNSMTFNSARIIGPAIGGALLVAVGAGWCFLINGLTVFAVVGCLLLMRLPKHEAVRNDKSPWQQLRQGLSYVQHQPNLRALLLLALVFSVFGISYSTVLPAFVDKVLRQGAGAFGAVNMMTGVGAVTGAFIVAQYGERGWRGRWLSAAILTFPLILTVFSLASNYVVALVLAVMLGVTFMFVFTLVNTLLQTHLVDEMRGRVLSLYTLTFFGFAPFGNLLIGWLAEWIGLSESLILSALLCFVGALIVIVKTPTVRRLA